MNRTLSRLAAIAVFAMLAAVAWLGVAAPLADWRSRTATRTDDLRMETGRLAETLAAMEAERGGLTGSDTSTLVWTAERAGQASAMVQARLSDLGRKHGLSFRSIAPLPARDLPLAQAIGFRVEFDAPLDRLSGFLVAVEAELPLLVVERATLRRLPRPQAEAAQPQQPEVFVQIDIVAPVVITNGDDT